MVEYVEKAEFPEKVIDKIKPLDLIKNYLTKPHGEGQNLRKIISIILELGRCDASLATLYLV